MLTSKPEWIRVRMLTLRFASFVVGVAVLVTPVIVVV